VSDIIYVSKTDKPMVLACKWLPYNALNCPVTVLRRKCVSLWW